MATKNSRYAYTASSGKMADDKFDIEALKKGEAEMRDSASPNQKAMRYIQDDSLSRFMSPKAGAGRGGQGGPTARQADENRAMMSSAERAARDEAKAMKEQDAADRAYEASRTSYKKGGMTASKRADGIAQRGKTRGTMIMCGGGYMKGKK